MYYEHDGLKLFYEKIGHGKPLILIHGNSEDHTIFDKAVEILSQRYTCYLPDSRGHGQSDPVSELHYLEMAMDLIAFLEQKNIENAAVYGFSDGGIIGLLASMRTDRISRLAVSGANCTPKGVVPWLRCLIRAMNLAHKDPKLTLMEEEPHITSEELSGIQAKTLVLAGADDAVLKKETELIAASIPGSELRILSSETHGSYIVHNRKIGDLLFAWLSRTES